MKTNDKYYELIEKLSDKLGTTSEHLWSVLVTQAPISGIIDISICITLVMINIWWFCVVIKNDKNDDAFMYVLSIILLIGSFVFISCSMQNIASGLLNPEYWALKQLI